MFRELARNGARLDQLFDGTLYSIRRGQRRAHLLPCAGRFQVLALVLNDALNFTPLVVESIFRPHGIDEQFQSYGTNELIRYRGAGRLGLLPMALQLLLQLSNTLGCRLLARHRAFPLINSNQCRWNGTQLLVIVRFR